MAVTGAWAQTDLETPLTLEAKTAGTIVVESPISGMQYTLNGGEKQAVTSDAITVAVGDKVQFYGDGTSITSYDGCKITGGDAECYIYGNIMSLVDETGFATATELTGGRTFSELFSDNKKLYSHDTKELVLPATTLAEFCYSSMFSGCEYLTAAPELPATTLASRCYSVMFRRCTSLTVAPELPATTLAESCYLGMFSACTSLTSAPELPATTLTEYCYNRMFSNCTSLTVAPELPATTLAEYCYAEMFSGCTSLTAVPELPATTLAEGCYAEMFGGCTSLTAAPELPATTLAMGCYLNMFLGCTSLTAAPKLPATTLAELCYANMFWGCTSLTAAPKLPATTLAESCYASMFWDCTSLTAAPKLPATTLAEGCYNGMFSDCTSLTSVTCLATDISAEMSTSSWLFGVSATGTFIKAPGMTAWTVGGDGIPKGWTVEECTSYNATWDSDDEEKEKWTIAPATPCEGQDVTATYSGTRHVKSVKIAQGAWAQTSLTPNGDKTVWTLAAAPAYDIELSAEYYTDLLDSEDNTNAYSSISGNTADIWLGRTLQTGSYNTFAVPFSISSEKMTELGMTAKKLTSSSFTGGVLTLNFEDATSIEAGKPYLVKVSENVVNPTFDGVTVSGIAVTNDETNAVDFIPTLGATTVTGEAKSILFLGAGNKLYNPSAESLQMKGFRAYFQLKGEAAQAKASAFILNFDYGETTGINSINNSKFTINKEEGIYTLDGRRIQGEPTQKGVYIVNGKKVVK